MKGGCLSVKTYCSTYIKKKSMASSMAAKLETDIFTYNTMLRSMVRDLGLPHSKDEPTIHVQYKNYGLSDYMVTSMERTASGIRDSAKECLALDIETKEGRIKQANQKIEQLEYQILNMQKIKDSLITRNKARKAGTPIPKFVNYFGSTIYPEPAKDGGLSFTVDFYRGKNRKRKRSPLFFANEYLFEILYVDPYIKKRKRRINQIKGRIHNLETKLSKLKRDMGSKAYHICFGGKKLMRQRSTVVDVNAWHDAFTRRRTREMLLVGRHDATQGNFMVKYDCTTRTLSYTALSGTVITLPNVHFPYGQEDVDAAVSASRITKQNKKLPKDKQIPCWEPGPVTWAIKDCGNTFQVKCMVSVQSTQTINSCFDDGCVSIDMNYDHLAVAELNQYGQLMNHFVIPFRMDGRTSNQIDNAISEALEVVFQHAVNVKKPIAMERIKNLKKELVYGNGTRNRKISQFAYGKIEMLAESKAQKYALAVRSINPAYTSQIGKLKYMGAMGLSIHESAAYVIGRRAMGFKDRVPNCFKHLMPPKKRDSHCWAQWASVSTPLKSIPICKFYEKIDYGKYKTMTALKEALTA